MARWTRPCSVPEEQTVSATFTLLLSVEEMATAKVNAFWVFYAPAEQESFQDVLNLVDKVLYGDSVKKHGFFAGDLHGGRRCIDAVLLSSTSIPVSAIVSPTK